ncbi:MAG: GntR family transcriptional regulator [Pseudonocardiales bacterium]|nr:GntR family transcriptional regulator [Pseudonocardiales bacterium]
MDELSARVPKYHRVADALRTEIRAGNLHPGQRLPAETTLVERFRVSLPTVRQALSVLRAEGLIESRHGVGTFVKEQRRLHRRSRGRYGSARGHHQLLTHHLRHEIVFAGRGPAPTHIAEIMGIAPGAEVVIRRRNLFDKDTAVPEEIGASYLPISVAGGTFLEEPTVVPKALFLCVEDLTGHRYTRARDQWIARMPTAEESVILELPTGAPVMHVVHTARDEHGAILEISESVWPADRMILIDDYDIEQEPHKPEVPSEI